MLQFPPTPDFYESARKKTGYICDEACLSVFDKLFSVVPRLKLVRLQIR